MSVSIPAYLKGNNVSLFTVGSVSVNTSGVATPATPVDLHLIGTFDGFEYTGNLKLEEISPADGFVTNYVPTKDDFTVTIHEIEKGDGSSTLMTLYGSFAYIRVAGKVLLPGGTPGTNDNIFAAIVIRESITKGIVEGKNAVIMTCKPCGLLPYYGSVSGITV